MPAAETEAETRHHRAAAIRRRLRLRSRWRTGDDQKKLSQVTRTNALLGSMSFPVAREVETLVTALEKRGPGGEAQEFMQGLFL